MIRSSKLSATMSDHQVLLSSMQCRNQRVGYITIPPGHNKSRRHNRIKGLLNANSLVKYSGLPDLEALAADARKTENWAKHNRQWAQYLNQELATIPGQIVVLVPSDLVGVSGGWTEVGCACLNYSAWDLHSHVDDLTVGSYAETTKEVNEKNGYVFKSNVDLEAYIVASFTLWGCGLVKGIEAHSRM